jgi:hypothetical protein
MNEWDSILLRTAVYSSTFPRYWTKLHFLNSKHIAWTTVFPTSTVILLSLVVRGKTSACDFGVGEQASRILKNFQYFRKTLQVLFSELALETPSAVFTETLETPQHFTVLITESRSYVTTFLCMIHRQIFSNQIARCCF